MSNYYELIKKGLSSAANVTAAAVHKAAEVAKDLAEDLTSFKALKDYKLAGHIATAGPGNTWKIYSAVSKKPGRQPFRCSGISLQDSRRAPALPKWLMD